MITNKKKLRSTLKKIALEIIEKDLNATDQTWLELINKYINVKNNQNGNNKTNRV